MPKNYPLPRARTPHTPPPPAALSPPPNNNLTSSPAPLTHSFSGELTIDEVMQFVEKARDDGKHHEKVMKLFIRVLALLLCSVLLNAVAMFGS